LPGNRRSVTRRLQLLLVCFCLCALVLAGCQEKKGNEQQQTTPKTSQQGKNTGQQTVQPTQTTVAVYYLKYTDTDAYLVREEHSIRTAGDVKQAAVEELVKGSPTTKGAGRVLPAETKVNSVKVVNGLATVDFNEAVLKASVGSDGEGLGIASIVNTLTEFPGVDKVSFTVNGQLTERVKDWWGHVGLSEQPFKRNLDDVWEPSIWLTSPRSGATIASPVTISGSARVFEAAVSLRIVDKNNKVLAKGSTMASEGAPGRGDFKTSLAFQAGGAGEGYVEAFWESPKDGSEQGLVRLLVKF
jgi:germination protein M